MINKKNQGITLIALVITIIVMLILVVVTIKIVTNGGIISKAQEAKKAQEKAQEKEKVELAVQSAKVDNTEIELITDNLEKELKEIFKEEYGNLIEEDGWIYIGKYQNYLISRDGKILLETQEFNYKIYGNYEKILPNEYQEVEYIKSTGTQRIQLPEMRKGDILNIKIASESSEAEAGFFGIPSACELYFQNNALYDWQHVSLIKPTSGNKINYGEIYEISAKANCNGNPFLFAYRTDRYPFTGKIYRYYSERNDYIYINLIPCYSIEEVRNSNGELCPAGTIGLYDTVEEKFYTNQGTDIFLKGEDILGVREGVGDKNGDKYIIQLKIKTTNEEVRVNVTLNSPLIKVGDVADYLDLKNKKVVRYIGEDGNILSNPIEEKVEIENLPNIKDIISIQVNTTIKPSKIDKIGIFEKLLPDEYQQVEYIESTGKQYINTGFNPNINTKYYLELMSTNNSSDYRWFIGSGNRGQYGKTSLFALANNVGNFYHEITGNNVNATSLKLNVKYNVEFEVPNLVIDGSKFSTGRTTLQETGYPIWIFACNNAGSAYDNKFFGKIYVVKIYDNNELVRNYIPCYNIKEVEDVTGKVCSVGTIGMYDTVNNQFYINQGEGIFFKGYDMY